MIFFSCNTDGRTVIKFDVTQKTAPSLFVSLTLRRMTKTFDIRELSLTPSKLMSFKRVCFTTVACTVS